MGVLKFDLVNVFISDGQKFSGNPLAVFYEAKDLSTSQCQVLARQFNLSEITFPYDIEATSYSTRIFTPGTEIPFAGHPTLGTCFALLYNGLDKAAGRVTQTTLSGETILSFPERLVKSEEPSLISMEALPKLITGRITKAMHYLPSALGLAAQRVQFVRRASCGLPWLYACLESPEAVVNAKISCADMTEWCKEVYGSLSSEEAVAPLLSGIVTFAVQGHESGKVVIKARVYFEEYDVLTEDSATGSAALGLGLVLHSEGIVSAASPEYKILQGYEALKPSQLFGSVNVDSTGQKVTSVTVSGNVVRVGGGEIAVPAAEL